MVSINEKGTQNFMFIKKRTENGKNGFKGKLT